MVEISTKRKGEDVSWRDLQWSSKNIAVSKCHHKGQRSHYVKEVNRSGVRGNRIEYPVNKSQKIQLSEEGSED